jgi:hypothetical protein
MSENCEKVVLTIQKFLNGSFKHTELFAMLDRQKDFLLQKHVLYKTDDNEYNALWDTMGCVEEFFAYGKSPNLVIGVANFSVLGVFNHNYKQRKTKSQLAD